MIEELIQLAKDMREAYKRGEKMGLSDDELAFYDALAANESAREVMGDEKIRSLAHELIHIVKEHASIDWTVRESARAKLKVMVKRLLKKHGYPPDLQKKATDTVIEQAEVVAREWSE